MLQRVKLTNKQTNKETKHNTTQQNTQQNTTHNKTGPDKTEPTKQHKTQPTKQHGQKKKKKKKQNKPNQASKKQTNSVRGTLGKCTSGGDQSQSVRGIWVLAPRETTTWVRFPPLLWGGPKRQGTPTSPVEPKF